MFCFYFLSPVASASTQFADVKHRSELSDDDPLYDSVASDEDYVTAEQLAKCLKVAVCILVLYFAYFATLSVYLHSSPSIYCFRSQINLVYVSQVRHLVIVPLLPMERYRG